MPVVSIRVRHSTGEVVKDRQRRGQRLQIGAVYLCREPLDIHKPIIGLSALVEQALEREPFAAAVCAFSNLAYDQLKVLYRYRNTG